MKKIWKLLLGTLVSFIFLGWGWSLLSYAEVSIPSQIFDLWTNVKGIWNMMNQTLMIQTASSGTGQIIMAKWNSMVDILNLKTEEN